MGVEDKVFGTAGKSSTSQKKAWDGLLAALAAPTPDEGEVKAAVAAYIDAQAKCLILLRVSWTEELAHLTPVQQGKYLVAMENWRQQCMPKVCIPTTK